MGRREGRKEGREKEEGKGEGERERGGRRGGRKRREKGREKDEGGGRDIFSSFKFKHLAKLVVFILSFLELLLPESS